jgi:hypothetical protein
MRILIGIAMAVMFGCAAPWEDPSQGLTAQASSGGSDDPSAWPTCPHRPDCTHDNGTGVYFEEGGRAAMDPLELMIVQFINNGSSVSVVGRYHQKATGFWEFTMGRVEGVLTTSGLLRVLSMRASSTLPTWSIEGPPGVGIIDLTDGALVNQKLVLSFPIENSPHFYTFWLNGRLGEWTSPKGPGGIPKPMYKYPAVYQPVSSTWNPIGPSRGYCVDANKQPDPVLFQEGIDVHPVFGSVTRPPSTTKVLTMSCRKGAIATVFAWGYSYLGIPADTFYYDAGIHMKRASYCADGEAYTANGTHIWIFDDRKINAEVGPALEARWSPTGATCLTTPRHPTLAVGFTGCRSGPLPPCSSVTFPLSAPSLIDWAGP